MSEYMLNDDSLDLFWRVVIFCAIIMIIGGMIFYATCKYIDKKWGLDEEEYDE